MSARQIGIALPQTVDVADYPVVDADRTVLRDGLIIGTDQSIRGDPRVTERGDTTNARPVGSVRREVPLQKPPVVLAPHESAARDGGTYDLQAAGCDALDRQP